jgi:hypothetical protein
LTMGPSSSVAAHCSLICRPFWMWFCNSKSISQVFFPPLFIQCFLFKHLRGDGGLFFSFSFVIKWFAEFPIPFFFVVAEELWILT